MVPKRINKKKTNETIKWELLNLLQENDNIEEQELNETANNSQEAIVIIRRYEDIIKKARSYLVKQGELFKTFKDTESFFDSVGQSRSAIYIQISLYKFLKKYSLLKKSVLQSIKIK